MPSSLIRRTLVEQAAHHLREGIQHGRWRDKLPGVRRLASDLDVSNETIRAALKLLEEDGSLAPADAGKARRIVAKKQGQLRRRALRAAILPSESLDTASAHTKQLILRLVSAIEHAGHDCVIAPRPLAQIDYRLERLARLVNDFPADAWIAYTPSHEVLDWFVQNKIPVLALGGHSQDLPVARSRTDLSGAMNGAVDSLVGYGHRRIVLISARHWRHPTLHPATRTFVERMRHHQLTCSNYNLPDWDETAAGLDHLLRVLFQSTPPTALILTKPIFTAAVLCFLAERNLRVPHHVSIISVTTDPIFAMRSVPISHFAWPIEPHIRRISRWVGQLARGRSDLSTKIVDADFVAGGTIGPVLAPKI